MSSLKSELVTPPCLEPYRIHSWLQKEVEWSHGARLCDVRLNRLWAGRQGRLTFELALDLTYDGSVHTHTLQGGNRAAGSPPRFHTCARMSRHGLRGLRLVSDELGLWCCTPDRDWKLPAVRVLLDDGRAASVLAATAAGPLLGLDRDGAQVRCEIATYRANKRCALRAWSTDPAGRVSVFVKVFRHMPEIEHVEALRRLPVHIYDRSHGRVRVPTLLDSCPARRLLITADITSNPCDGRTLCEGARTLGTNSDDLSAAATALAILHDVPDVTVPKVHTLKAEFQTVCRWVRALQVLQEQRYLRLRELAIELSRSLTTIEEPGATLIHRDFFAAQLLQAGEILWVLDLDTLCLGHPEVDVATFVAHLFLDELMAGAAMPEVIRNGASFVENYLQNGGRIVKSRLRFYLPCALARLGAIHLARRVPTQVVDGLWELARSNLAGSWWLG